MASNSADDMPSTCAARRKDDAWNYERIVSELRTPDQGARFAEKHGLIPKTMVCPIHKTLMNRSKGGKFGFFVCRRGTCMSRPRVSVAAGTWFEQTRISVPHIFYLMYCFVENLTKETVQRKDFCEEGKTLSSSTITDWYNYCREAVVIYQLDHQDASGEIGGPGRIVQINKRKFGKRKLNDGNQGEDHWLLGMIEDESEDLRLEVCPDNVRSAKVLIPLIKKHVAEGTTIRTDCLGAFEGLSDFGFTHLLLDVVDVTRTQRIESQWADVKRFFSTRANHTGKFADILVEYLWRKSVKKANKDPFLALIECIKYMYETE
ncbi:uncharacterized protein LOC118752600 [Rhagoletis pomonella]|uniref:uncharacterized protein LOC118752600 n=1 Tax=Rhagoletis pomonella TaxID=28610 RepID=UPI00178435B7|nr:uncharacterized protein LOC118752600 [Rhagoletis pomonella]